MPPLSGSIGSIDYVVYSKAGRVVAGDLFGMNITGDGRVAIYLGDVAGKGVGAGMLMASIQASIGAYLDVGGRSDAMVQRLNEYVSEHSDSAEFATMFFLQFEPETRVAEIVDGGHGYALLIRGKDIQPLHCEGGPPVGAVPGMEFGQSSVNLEKGDRVVIYSDGVAEQRDTAHDEEFGVERVIEAVRESSTPEEDVEKIVAALMEFAGGDLFADDVTIACVLVP